MRYLLLLCLFACGLSAAEYQLLASTHLGVSGNEDEVVGVEILADGSLLVAINLPAGMELGTTLRGDPGLQGCLLHLDAKASRILDGARLCARVHDLDLDGADMAYLAGDSSGLVKIDPQGLREIWRAGPGTCTRVDVADDGRSAVRMQDPDAVLVFDADGAQIGFGRSRHRFMDLAIDTENEQVIVTGFNVTRSFDGKRTFPVHICYVGAWKWNGEQAWMNYDWTGRHEDPRWLNRSANNMADTRANRVNIGADGKLYVVFETAGGNHLFRWHPKDIMQPFNNIAKGGKYHDFFNSNSEHKMVVGRFDLASGEPLLMQQICGRHANGKAGAVMSKGDIHADRAGRIYIAGHADGGFPLQEDAPYQDEYAGGGCLIVLSADMREMRVRYRLQPKGGRPAALAIREMEEEMLIAYGGGRIYAEHPDNGKRALHVTAEAAQPQHSQPDDPEAEDSFVAIFTGPLPPPESE